MSFNQQRTEGNSRAALHLFLLSLVFVVGFACFRMFRFTSPSLNYTFGLGVLCTSFLALRSLSQLRKIPKVIGFILVSPLLLLSLLMILAAVACDLNPRNKGCRQELQTVRQDGYSVHLVLDGCGGAVSSFMLGLEQRRPVLPGLYVFRSIDFFDGAYEGKMTPVGTNEIQLHIPKGVEGSGWTQEIDRTYTLKRHVYF